MGFAEFKSFFCKAHSLPPKSLRDYGQCPLRTKLMEGARMDIWRYNATVMDLNDWKTYMSFFTPEGVLLPEKKKGLYDFLLMRCQKLEKSKRYKEPRCPICEMPRSAHQVACNACLYNLLIEKCISAKGFRISELSVCRICGAPLGGNKFRSRGFCHKHYTRLYAWELEFDFLSDDNSAALRDLEKNRGLMHKKEQSAKPIQRNETKANKSTRTQSARNKKRDASKKTSETTNNQPETRGLKRVSWT